MYVSRGELLLEISLTDEEVDTVQAGTVVGKRSWGIAPEAKVEVMSLSAIEPDTSLDDRQRDDYLTRGRNLPVRVSLDEAGDLQCAIPALTLSDRRIGGAYIPRAGINAVSDEAIKGMIPPAGVVIHFGGSIERINVFEIERQFTAE